MLRKILTTITLLSLLAGCATGRRTGGETDTAEPNQESPASQAQTAWSVPPKIGIILGPGGMKSFAHIGVLRELESARIPINMIAGMEWGALVAGTYSLKRKANDVEWKLFKIPKDILPRKEFMGHRTEPTSMNDFTPFLENTFGSMNITDGEIPFICPTKSLTKYASLIFQRNKYVDALQLCLPFPPLFKPYQNWVANPYSVKALSDALKKAGMDYVILVNVTPGIQRLNDDASAAEFILWNHVMDEMNEGKNYVNYVIDVNIQDKSVLDFDSRREFISIGQQYGKIAAQRLARILGF